MGQAHNFALSGGAACGSLLSANPHQREEGVGPNEDEVSTVGRLGVQLVSTKVSVDIQSQLQLIQGVSDLSL